MNDYIKALLSLVPNAQYYPPYVDEDGNEVEARWEDERPQPTQAEIDAEITRLATVETQAVVNQEARDYLVSTDWYITRQAETGVEVPSDVLTKRAEARASVIDA